MWTPDELLSEAAPWTGEIWRAVESQFKVSSPMQKLTDTLAEQELLENILERSKPAFPDDCKGFHYLLVTPFRYAPYPYGSRFRRTGQKEALFMVPKFGFTAAIARRVSIGCSFY